MCVCEPVSVSTVSHIPSLGSSVASGSTVSTVAKSHIWTAQELLTASFPEPRWAVPGLVPEGFTVLAASPKIGKSWMTLGMAVSVVTGQLVMGAIEPEPGHCLVLALEDTPRRLRERLTKLLGTKPPPHGLHIVTEWEAGQPGLHRLHQWLQANPQTRLVVIDVIARLRVPNARGETYQDDYLLGASIKQVADAHQVGIVGVHHTRKATADDFVASISGTHGLMGSADSMLVLRRGRNEASAVLSITGRDVEESEKALTFNDGLWTLSSKPVYLAQATALRRRLLAALEQYGPTTPKHLALVTAINHSTIRTELGRLLDDGLITKDGPTYQVTAPTVTQITNDVLNQLTERLSDDESPSTNTQPEQRHGIGEGPSK